MGSEAPKRVWKRTDKQLLVLKLLAGVAKHVLLFGGSRSGKTFILVYAVLVRALKSPGSRHVIIRKHFKDVRQSVGMDTLPKVVALAFPGLALTCNKADWYFTLPNGSEIWLCGLDDKDRADKILGKEFATIYFNESSELSYESIEVALTRLAQNCRQTYNGADHGPLVNKAFYDCNPPSKAHWSYRQFIMGLHPTENRALTNPKLYAQEQVNPLDNKENLPPGYIEEILAGMSERKRKRFMLGEWLDDLEGALWKRSEMIDPFRVQKAPEGLERVVVAIDPAVTNNERSDEHGLVGAGMKTIRGERHYYILDDRSRRGSPSEWAHTAINMYHEFRADRVVGEVNNGGDMVESTLRNVERGVSYMAVHATRGKIVRAEPVAALYEKGLVHHVGVFPQMEDEMCSFTGAESEDSPNRMDALVWALTYLSERAGGSRAITA